MTIHSHVCRDCGRLRTCFQKGFECRERDRRGVWTCCECIRAREPLERWLQEAFDRIQSLAAR